MGPPRESFQVYLVAGVGRFLIFVRTSFLIIRTKFSFCSSYHVRPSENDLIEHTDFIREAVKRDATLAKSKVCLVLFVFFQIFNMFLVFVFLQTRLLGLC